MTRRALVLAGGGVRGAFQVGMIRELTKTRDFQVIRGVSVGAINGAFLAQASTAGDSGAALQQQAAALENVWRELGIVLGRVGRSMPQADEFERMEMMGQALKQLIGSVIQRDRLLEAKRDFTTGYVSLLSGRYMEAAPEQPDILELVRASAALPPLFPCVDTVTDLLVDGGYRNITPLASAFKAKIAPDEIYVLLTRRITTRDGRLAESAVEPQRLHPEWTSRKDNPRALYAQVAARLVEILMDEVYIEDIKRAIQENSLARVLDELEARESPPALDKLVHRRSRYVPLYVLAPLQRFNLDAPPGHGDDIAAFDANLIRGAIEHGASVAADRSKWVWHPERETAGDPQF
jgi:NTE family protein